MTETATRHAVIRGKGHDALETVRRYLPSNYTADSDGGSIFIHGTDNAGWTLDGYVIPRLASGLIRAEEIPAPDPAPSKASVLLTGADAAYDREDQAWFDALPTESLTLLWGVAVATLAGASWDDEVFDALAKRGWFDS